MNDQDVTRCKLCGKVSGFCTCLANSAFDTVRSDGIAQGRREAAEADCELCGACIHVLVKCKNYHAILGTASAEKTDKGEI
jgi:hypothetical protein